MKRYIMLGLDFILVASLLLFSCKKQSNGAEQGQMEINFSLLTLKSSNSDTLAASNLCSVVVSIADNNGIVLKNSEKIDLYCMNGNYISKPLSLPKGSYKLTRFFVLDWQNNIVYAAPLTGSSKASLVSKPLPLIFSVQTNSVTKVVPEVLNAAGCTPADFGYTTFSFNISQTFDFLVGTFIYDDLLKNYKLTSSTISIYANTDSIFTGQLIINPSNALTNVYDSLEITNKITLPERFNKYSLVVSKPGYKTTSQIFTKEELKLHLRSLDKGPLVLILEKVPISLPTLSTNIISDLTQTTATCGGTITADGGGTIIARGVCWSKSQTPTITDSKTTDDLSGNSFNSLITGLDENTTYYARSYATNSFGTGYGNTVSFQTLPAQSTLNDGLVAYYKFNSDVKDYSGYGNDGTYYGRGVFATGNKSDLNGAIDLNGSSDYVFINNSASLSLNKQISLCAWYYCIPFYGNGNNSLISKYPQNDYLNPDFLLSARGSDYGTPASSFAINIASVESSINSVGPAYNFNLKRVFTYQLYNWYFIVGTYDGNQQKLYVNGELLAWKSISGDIKTSLNDIYMGKTPLNRPSYDFLKGKVDEVRIYNRALTDAEILSLYQQ